MNPFVKSERILQTIQLSQLYKVRPSELMGIEDDPYVAYCFDEACAFIKLKVDNGEQIRVKKRYTSFKDMYKNYQ